jgi:hypothetical protein
MLIKIAGHSAGVWTGGTIWAIVMLAEFVEMVASDSSHHLPTAAEHVADHRTLDQHRDKGPHPGIFISSPFLFDQHTHFRWVNRNGSLVLKHLNNLSHNMVKNRPAIRRRLIRLGHHHRSSPPSSQLRGTGPQRPTRKQTKVCDPGDNRSRMHATRAAADLTEFCRATGRG